MLRVKANAKINLSLDVLGTLPNGYHEVKMIMQSVDLCDELQITPENNDSIILTCDNDKLSCGDDNLIIRAAKALMDYVGKHNGVSIKLIKNIPMAAGLAGGSADAAATLVGINRLFDYGLSTAELKAIGAKLGADIPFCIQGGTSLAEGIGEILTPISPLTDMYILLVKPPIDVSTKYVYDNLILDNETVHPETDLMIGLLKEGRPDILATKLCNILETVTVKRYPTINDIKNTLLDDNALGALMSGSGPTVFGLFNDESTAEAASEHIKDAFGYKDVFICRPAEQGTVITG